ncbi:uncharacterized protein N7518_006617 [Penicillium psychrosexuale]|uniref:uncharacterized protein n=1 Tax=Penicillium psychrosexuale TaxID=1002107 RepID=UPI0025456999|nr:uncharacterized protein N7518_006617 [Penicillium psychrosexuale]KAJ5789606.1 hypothetical protein N7518_006617 [Penicillium psychrosexuale]
MSEKSRVDSEQYGPLLLWFNNLDLLFKKMKPATKLAKENAKRRVLVRDLEKIDDQSRVTRRHIRRSIDANLLLSQEVAILKVELKKAGISRSNAEAKKNGQSILGTRGLVLAPTCANKKMVDRRTADSKKLERFQAKHTKKLEAE